MEGTRSTSRPSATRVSRHRLRAPRQTQGATAQRASSARRRVGRTKASARRSTPRNVRLTPPTSRSAVARGSATSTSACDGPQAKAPRVSIPPATLSRLGLRTRDALPLRNAPLEARARSLLRASIRASPSSSAMRVPISPPIAPMRLRPRTSSGTNLGTAGLCRRHARPRPVRTFVRATDVSTPVRP